MHFSLKQIPTLALAMMLSLCACTDPNDPDNPDNPGNTGNEQTDGYGTLGNNLITIGSTKDIQYTKCVLLGTVDFPKISSDHTYGIVYMEALPVEDFDYEGRLAVEGHNDRYDKVEYSCIKRQITSSAADGKFEKQLVDLKPNTTYYYRAYVAIGANVNYSKVESFTTKDPTPEITLQALDPSDIYVLNGRMNGMVNVGNLSDVNEHQNYGFLISDSPLLNAPEKLTYEYYDEWVRNHFETDEEIERPQVVITNSNLNGRINIFLDEHLSHVIPGVTYYYRTFFEWNDKYFYSPEVKALTTLGTDKVTIGTLNAIDITAHEATLKGDVPFSLIGQDAIYGGFLYSKVYTNSSEFKLMYDPAYDELRPENNDIKMVDQEIYTKDFSATIERLEAETTYYFCAWAIIGTDKDDMPIIIYGPVDHFTTEAGDDDPNDIPTPDVPGSDIRVTSDSAYPWYEQPKGTWISGNRGYSNSVSTLTVIVRGQAGQVFHWSQSVSSEERYDLLTLSINGIDRGSWSGSDTRSLQYTLTNTGEYIFQFTYSKDGGSNYDEDCAKVWNMYIE